MTTTSGTLSFCFYVLKKTLLHFIPVSKVRNSTTCLFYVIQQLACFMQQTENLKSFVVFFSPAYKNWQE